MGESNNIAYWFRPPGNFGGVTFRISFSLSPPALRQRLARTLWRQVGSCAALPAG